MEKWIVVIGGKPKGPFSKEELKALPLTPDMFVRTEGMDDYKEAHEVAELRELFGFKKQTTSPQYFATLDLRLLAVVIDLFIVAVAYFAIALILIVLIEDRIVRAGILFSGIVIIPLLKTIYATRMEASPLMATFGKRWLGIKVCTESGLQINISTALIRNFAGILSLGTAGIGYLIGFFDRKQQCLHDKIASTLVIKDRLM